MPLFSWFFWKRKKYVHLRVVDSFPERPSHHILSHKKTFFGRHNKMMKGRRPNYPPPTWSVKSAIFLPFRLLVGRKAQRVFTRKGLNTWGRAQYLEHFEIALVKIVSTRAKCDSHAKWEIFFRNHGECFVHTDTKRCQESTPTSKLYGTFYIYIYIYLYCIFVHYRSSALQSKNKKNAPIKPLVSCFRRDTSFPWRTPSGRSGGVRSWRRWWTWGSRTCTSGGQACMGKKSTGRKEKRVECTQSRLDLDTHFVALYS